jgi:hypothetical protein
MKDHGDKCYKMRLEGDDFETEVSYKETYIKNMIQVAQEIKIALTRDLFDSIEVQVMENAAYLSQNAINLNNS